MDPNTFTRLRGEHQQIAGFTPPEKIGSQLDWPNLLILETPNGRIIEPFPAFPDDGGLSKRFFQHEMLPGICQMQGATMFSFFASSWMLVGHDRATRQRMLTQRTIAHEKNRTEAYMGYHVSRENWSVFSNNIIRPANQLPPRLAGKWINLLDLTSGPLDAMFNEFLPAQSSLSTG